MIGAEAFSAFAHYGKIAHNYLSFPFVLGILMMLVLWIRDNIPEKADLPWIKQGGGFLNNGFHPEAGRFNAGQKMIFWTVVLGGLAMALSGYMLMFPFYLTGVGGMQISHIIHSLGTAVMVAVILGHIYIGTLGMEGAFDAMGNGEVDLNAPAPRMADGRPDLSGTWENIGAGPGADAKQVSACAQAMGLETIDQFDTLHAAAADRAGALDELYLTESPFEQMSPKGNRQTAQLIAAAFGK